MIPPRKYLLCIVPVQSVYILRIPIHVCLDWWHIRIGKSIELSAPRHFEGVIQVVTGLKCLRIHGHFHEFSWDQSPSTYAKCRPNGEFRHASFQASSFKVTKLKVFQTATRAVTTFPPTAESCALSKDHDIPLVVFMYTAIAMIGIEESGPSCPCTLLHFFFQKHTPQSNCDRSGLLGVLGMSAIPHLYLNLAIDCKEANGCTSSL